jgi:hypothetical protein
MLKQSGLSSNQDFLIFPDPIYWQVAATLTYEKTLKFIQGQPVTTRTHRVQPPSNASSFYKDLQEAPLNYGSLNSRSCGKATLIRQVAFGKRCVLSMRGMIVPDASLRPNEIRLPDFIVRRFKLRGQWIILNRMPTLQPGNIVALRVPDDGWRHTCFGIPLEIVESINGDFDGDEINVYMVPNMQAQAECATLLNAEWEMKCFVSGLKLAPSQDMLVAYHRFYDDVDFLPYKNRDLNKTLRVIYDIFDSKRAFDAIDAMRQFYLDALQKRTFFALTLKEMVDMAREKTDLEGFKQKFQPEAGSCLVTQVLSGAKGSFEHLYQIFVEIGQQEDVYVKNSFWTGLNPVEAVAHTKASHRALSETGKIWQPGYGYTKIAYNIHDLKVDYLGRLVDGQKRVVEQDVLDAVHHTDIMSEDAFQYLLQSVLLRR